MVLFVMMASSVLGGEAVSRDDIHNYLSHIDDQKCDCSHFHGKTIVAGKVLDDNNEPIADAYVKVVCDGHTVRTHTWENGIYAVGYPSYECHSGDDVRIYSSKDDMSGSVSGTIKDCDSCLCRKFNVNIFRLQIPEFGLVAGLIAFLVSITAFMLIRR